MSRILVIKHGALGDFVQAFAPFSSLRAAFPSASITLLTSSPFAELGRMSPWFDEVMIDDRPPAWRLASLWRLTRKIAGYDRVFDLQSSGRTGLYFRLAGRPVWSGQAKGCSHPHRNPSRREMHALARQDDQLRDAGITPLPRAVPDWLIGHGPALERPYGVLVPGSAPHRPAKRWPAPQFGSLARTLVQRGWRPVIVGGNADRPLGAVIRTHCPDALDLTGQTSLPALADILAHAAIAIGNDTGPMHLAAAMDTPCLTLFSQESDPRRSAPVTITPGRSRVLSVPDLAHLPAARLEALLSSWP